MSYFTELPVPVAAVSVFYTPDDGRLTPETCRERKSAVINSASCFITSVFYLTLYYDARKHKIKKKNAYKSLLGKVEEKNIIYMVESS